MIEYYQRAESHLGHGQCQFGDRSRGKRIPEFFAQYLQRLCGWHNYFALGKRVMRVNIGVGKHGGRSRLQRRPSHHNLCLA